MRRLIGPQRGFTYIGLLMAVFVMGLMLTVVSRVWSTTEQRERETQLLFIGHAYRIAIASYYASGHRFPTTLQDLVQDERFPVPKRHLRRIYPDPMTGNADWTLVMTPSGQGIMGVASISQLAPIKRGGFEPIDEPFKDGDCYCSWQFIYYPNRFSRSIAPGTLDTNPPGNTNPADNTNAPGSPGTFTPVTPGTLAPGTFTPVTPGTLAPRSISSTP